MCIKELINKLALREIGIATTLPEEILAISAAC